jgi:hypothetical protein
LRENLLNAENEIKRLLKDVELAETRRGIMQRDNEALGRVVLNKLRLKMN